MSLAFWIAVTVSLTIVTAIMAWLFYMARDVPDASEHHVKRRLNPDQLRLLAYVLFVLVCLAAAVYELSLYDDLEPEAPRDGERQTAVEDAQP